MHFAPRDNIMSHSTFRCNIPSRDKTNRSGFITCASKRGERLPHIRGTGATSNPKCSPLVREGGYPRHLVGEEIPIWAQVVSVADVYDALTSQRCYKPAFTHEKAIDMIIHGECGMYSDLLISCLLECAEDIREGMHTDVDILRDKNIKERIRTIW